MEDRDLSGSLTQPSSDLEQPDKAESKQRKSLAAFLHQTGAGELAIAAQPENGTNRICSLLLPTEPQALQPFNMLNRRRNEH